MVEFAHPAKKLGETSLILTHRPKVGDDWGQCVITSVFEEGDEQLEVTTITASGSRARVRLRYDRGRSVWYPAETLGAVPYDLPVGGSGGGFLVTSELSHRLAAAHPVSENLTWEVEGLDGDIHVVTFFSTSRQAAVLSGKDAQKVALAIMNVSFLVLSSQMAAEVEKQRTLYWQALRILENLGLVEVYRVSTG